MQLGPLESKQYYSIEIVPFLQQSLSLTRFKTNHVPNVRINEKRSVSNEGRRINAMSAATKV